MLFWVISCNINWLRMNGHISSENALRCLRMQRWIYFSEGQFHFRLKFAAAETKHHSTRIWCRKRFYQRWRVKKIVFVSSKIIKLKNIIILYFLVACSYCTNTQHFFFFFLGRKQFFPSIYLLHAFHIAASSDLT